MNFYYNPIRLCCSHDCCSHIVVFVIHLFRDWKNIGWIQINNLKNIIIHYSLRMLWQLSLQITWASFVLIVFFFLINEFFSLLKIYVDIDTKHSASWRVSFWEIICACLYWLIRRMMSNTMLGYYRVKDSFER